jgi:hypothetical protein
MPLLSFRLELMRFRRRALQGNCPGSVATGQCHSEVLLARSSSLLPFLSFAQQGWNVVALVLFDNVSDEHSLFVSSFSYCPRLIAYSVAAAVIPSSSGLE